MTISSKDSHGRRLDFLVPGRPNDRINGEADWFPTPEEVERARRRLERQGAVRSLHPGEVHRLVPQGETPWLWWITAALWPAVWPALIVLTLILIPFPQIALFLPSLLR